VRRRTRSCKSHAHESAQSDEPYEPNQPNQSDKPNEPCDTNESDEPRDPNGACESYDSGGSGQYTVNAS
jgi:hypothetical protein